MDILKNTEAMGKRIFADLEKINFIRTSTSAEETKAANIIKDELAKEGMEATIEEFDVETADIHKVSLKALGKEWEIQGYRRSGSTPEEGLTARLPMCSRAATSTCTTKGQDRTGQQRQDERGSV